jgi:diguanylate cyclase (GGDEF)-like protein
VESEQFDGERTDTHAAPLRIRPVGPGKPCLVMLVGDFPGETWLLQPGTELSVGRGAGNEIRLPHGDVSRVHARLKCSASGKVDLIDLGSTNGTWVNGRRQLYRVLREGDKIQFGERTVFRFSFHDDLDEEFQRKLLGTPFLDRATALLTGERLLPMLRERREKAQVPEAVAVVVMGIDGFDLLEELLGQAVRDYFLRELTWIIRKSFSGEGTLYRVGPETFATLLFGLSPGKAIETAERIRKVVAGTRITHRGDQMVFSLAVGIACAGPGEAPELAELLARAADRCRQARTAGGDRVLAAG